MRTGTCLVLTLMVLGLIGACGDNPGNGSNNNSFIPCEGIEDCPPGYLCVSNICVSEADSGVPSDASTDPDIEVDPTTLDFGNPLLNVAVDQTLTITNVGGADLTIFSIVLEEDDTNHEYEASPVGNLAQVLAPGESMEVDVQLINTDEQADTGRLIINSNDLDEAMTTVLLVSELKGDGLAATCVMETADLYSPCVTNPEVIDFGPLPSDASAFQDVSLSNAGTGNTPLLVNDIYVTNNSGYVGQFHLDVVRFVEDPGNPGTYIEELIADPATTPFLLEPNDGAGAPEVLLIHVRFEATAALEGQPVPPEFLVIQTDDASNPNYQIPFMGDVVCPAGWVELDGMSPWCEYACTVTNGGVEDCEGIDNNCDGVIDEGCPVCGNGVVEGNETCDDGNHDNTDGCPDGLFGTCAPAECGDGHTQAGVEECDDGNSDNTDACTDDTANGGLCENAVCGDGFVWTGHETCDDGNHNNTDACPDGVFGSCAEAGCGDGFLRAGVEECDPPDGTTCDSNCLSISGTLDPNGCFDVSQVSYSCVGGLVNVNIGCVEFVDNSTTLVVQPHPADPCGFGNIMSGPSAAGGSFSSTCSYAGTCTENYTFSGTFTDNDHWTGDFNGAYFGSCFNCSAFSVPITAVRVACPCP